MNLVCLGVMKRLLHVWCKAGKNAFKLRQGTIDAISLNVRSFKKYVPKEFGRKCRDLSELEKWKAVEFRQFLLYSGVVALKDALPACWYYNFLLSTLHCVILKLN